MFSSPEIVTFSEPYNLGFSHFWTQQYAWCKGITTTCLFYSAPKFQQKRSTTSKVFLTT